MTDRRQSFEVELDAQGAVVIPPALGQAMGLKPGDRLVVRKAGDAIVLERRDVIERRLKARFAVIPKDVCLVGELIAEREQAAQRV